MASESVLNCIKSGRCLHLAKITTLEGWRSEEIAEVLAANDITDPQAFLDIVRKRDLEGYLFPSTYQFFRAYPRLGGGGRHGGPVQQNGQTAFLRSIRRI